MGRVGAWQAARTFACIAVCVCVLWIWGVCLKVLITGVLYNVTSYVISIYVLLCCSKTYTTMAMTGLCCLLWPSLVECMERMSSCWRLTSSTYVCLYCYRCALNLRCVVFESANYWRSMRHEVVCILIIKRYFAVQMNNTLQWRWWICVAWLTFVGWMYGTCWRLASSAYVCLYCCLCALNLRCVLESANYWRSIQCDVVCNLNLCANLLFK